ncbi:MAG: type II toxin-antitoxin system HicA family toxin [Planctomycetes bacterium]|nr:type II toxin-antitoxin system HicA family toxin [Planctomycetota bacterium]MCC8115715.1 type II toxin-antitoxin system HicA family toxin [Planctomycetota bacterium]MCD7895815.1 type II toxin-antitoxin system HicA family toxin [Planctomycetaceae bacterium]
MNAKHRKTLAALFARPVARTIPFRDLVALLRALGFTVRQGEGSRIDFFLGRDTLHLHEPHPGKELKPYQVKAVRAFLLAIGVTP